MAAGAEADPAAVLLAWADALADAGGEPLDEMLALVWGPRFDRAHALALLARRAPLEGAWVHAIQAFADRFDGLPGADQQALRRALLRIAENAECPASC